MKKKNNLKTITFTNGTIINEAIASKLYNFKENIALKFNSFNEDVQDFLVQKKGTGKKIKKALDLLLEIGYGKNNGVSLALETVITKYNYNEIETIYKFCRENNIIPYIEILTEQGLAKNNKDIGISKIHAYNLFKKLQNYDRLVWNIDWNITPPIVGQTCKRMLYSAYIRSDGNVQPCPGVEIVTENSNIRINSLADIISKNEIFIQAREIYKKIRGKCKDCDYSDCYGCRGTALFQNGGFLEEDPTCWYNN